MVKTYKYLIEQIQNVNGEDIQCWVGKIKLISDITNS